MASPKQVLALHFPEDMVQQIQGEANRHDRSLSWMVQEAWRIAFAELNKRPGVNDATFKNQEVPMHLAGHGG